MAKVLFGGGIAEIRGSEAGTTWSRNRGGSYSRQRVTPINPQTPAQLAMRTRLSSLATQWGTILTEAQRTAWEEFAQSFPITDRLGQVIILSGIQMYIRLNNRLLAGNAPQLVDAPANQAVTGLTQATNSFDLFTTAQVAWLPSGLETTERIQIEATPGISPGITFVKNRVRLIVSTANNPIPPTDYFAEWQARFGSLPFEGQKVVTMTRVLNTLNGALSNPFRSDTIVIDTTP